MNIKMDSIRSRYVLGTVILAALFLASVWISHVYVSSTVSETAQNSTLRNNVLNSHRVIRIAMRETDHQLQTYLVSPDREEYEQVVEQIDKSLSAAVSLLDAAWIKTNDQQDKLLHLLSNLKTYRVQALEVMAVRLNSDKLFPAYEVMNKEMLPQNIQFMTYVRLALDEASSQLSDDEMQQAFLQLNQIKDSWNSLIGSFRVYVGSRAMRLNDLNKNNKEFEEDIESQFKDLEKKLIILSANQGKYDYGIQVDEAIQNLDAIAQLWYQAYQKTKFIYENDNWRIDETIVNQNIKPLDEKIWISLYELELVLAESFEKDTNHLADMASGANSVLWSRMVIALVFIIIVFLAFELWVLEPIALIAKALKAEADGIEVKELPKANTLETRELVEAFDEMRSQVRIRQLELEHKAMHDVLTGLPNRLLLRRQLIQFIENAKKSDSQLALLMIDLNKFKEINDTLGHHMGDRVLREIGPRFISELGKNDLLARLGGDEFAILLPDSSVERANEIAERLNHSLDVNFNIDGQKLHVGCSIGIALYPNHGLDEHSLLQRADVAMYLAKHKGLNHLIYEESQDEQSAWQLSFKGELEHAINNNLLELYYQPRINLKKNSVTGFEALLRWHHHEHGLIPADEVHLLAEKSGLIEQFTKWVVNTSVSQLSEWLKNGLDLSISVNLSVWNLQDQKLFDCVKQALRLWNVPANKLILEIAESAVMSDPDSAAQALEQLSQLGVQISIDDFGIGFSSLQYLKSLPINELKIDKSFVMDLIVDENDADIVRSTINLAHDLGLNVLAEGVESQEIYDLIQILGCDDAQGYHMSMAMPAEHINKWMKESTWGIKPASQLKLIS